MTFDDIAGIDEAENELVEIVEFLKDWLQRVLEVLGTHVVLLAPGRQQRRPACGPGASTDAWIASRPVLSGRFTTPARSIFRSLPAPAHDR